MKAIFPPLSWLSWHSQPRPREEPPPLLGSTVADLDGNHVLSNSLAWGNGAFIFLKTISSGPQIEKKRKSTAAFPVAPRLKSKACGRKKFKSQVLIFAAYAVRSHLQVVFF